MYRWLCAPLGGQATDGCVGLLVEAQELTDHSSIQKSTVGIGVGKIGGLQLDVPQFAEDGLRGALLLVAEGVEVQDGQ